CMLVRLRAPPLSTLFPYTTLFRSARGDAHVDREGRGPPQPHPTGEVRPLLPAGRVPGTARLGPLPLVAERHPEAFRDLLDLVPRSEEHTSELQSRVDLVCRLLLAK